MNQHTESTTGDDRILARSEAPTGWLVFNNPARRNAVSLEMWLRIPALLKSFEEDPAIKVVVVTGAGDRAFVSGADVSQFEQTRATIADNEAYSAASGAAREVLRKLSKPTIAMIRGYCLGGGMSVALCCDLRVAEAEAKFGIPAARLGLGYALESVQRLVEIVGPAVAKELLFTARHFSAAEAVQVGLVNKVVESAALEPTVRECCDQIAANAPLSLRASKLAIDCVSGRRNDEARAAAMDAINACMASEDFVEGRRAFLEKRKPVFKGR